MRNIFKYFRRGNSMRTGKLWSHLRDNPQFLTNVKGGGVTNSLVTEKFANNLFKVAFVVVS